MISERTNAIEVLDDFITNYKIDKEQISKIVITGVGKDEIGDELYGIKTAKVNEFSAIGHGGLYLAGKKEALVISIGTGTAFVMAKKNKFKHIGGTGVGRRNIN